MCGILKMQAQFTMVCWVKIKSFDAEAQRRRENIEFVVRLRRTTKKLCVSVPLWQIF